MRGRLQGQAAAWAAPLLPLLLVLAAGGGVGAQDAALRFIDDFSGMAKCLDGSPMAYYHRPAVGSGAGKWLISYEGGGWCSSLEDCAARANGPLGSSKEYKNATQRAMLLGKLTSDQSRNPTFWNWNVVLVKYCDGGFYSGSVPQPVKYKNATLYFRGRYIHAALINSLMDAGLDNATDIVVSGCSAGAVQTYINLDYIKTLMPKTAHVVGLPDSGFLAAYEGPGACQYQERMISAFPLQNVAAALPKQCLDKFATSKEQWRCMFFVEHLVSSIQTPYFVLQSKFDYWQMDSNIFCEMFNVPNARVFGNYFQQTFAAAFANTTNAGYLLDSCTHHCGGWDFIRADDGLTQHGAFEAWYAATLRPPNADADADEQQQQQQQQEHRHRQSGSFPCLSCCFEGKLWGDAPMQQEHIKEMEDSASAAAAADLAIIPTIEEEEGEEQEASPRGRRLEASEYAAMHHIQELMVEMKQETADAEEDVLDKLIRIIQSFVPQPKPVDEDGKGTISDKKKAVEVTPAGGEGGW